MDLVPLRKHRRIPPGLWLFFFAALFLAGPAFAAQPFRVAFDLANPVGYDGPWQGVRVKVAETWLRLYPGSFWETNILSSTVCNDFKGEWCTSDVYDLSRSRSYNESFREIRTQEGLVEKTAFFNIQRTATQHLDTITIEEAHGSGAFAKYPEVSIRLIEKMNITYPNSLAVSPDLGTLSLGATDDYQKWGPYVGHVVLNELEMSNKIPSKTWGLHYGSVLLKQQGSLVFGGYDKSRVVGNPISYDLGGNVLGIRLDSISHGIGLGVTPDPAFKNETKVSPKIDVQLDPTLPYLYLPEDVCKSMVQGLPVTFDKDTGLYLWDTTNPLYRKLIKSAAYIGFNFPGTGSKLNTIKLPLALLDLRLEPPVKKVSTPYFPCRPSTEKKEVGQVYTLGRAFFQGAYVGMNWNEKKFWLGQAPGPDSGALDMQPLERTARELKPSASNTWEDSWLRYWDVEDPGNRKVPLPTGENDAGVKFESSGGSKGLSNGALIGTSVAAGVVAVTAMVLLWFFVRRNRKRRREQAAVSRILDNPKYGDGPESFSPPWKNSAQDATIHPLQYQQAELAAPPYQSPVELATTGPGCSYSPAIGSSGPNPQRIAHGEVHHKNKSVIMF